MRQPMSNADGPAGSVSIATSPDDSKARPMPPNAPGE
jgi:hypothetical protein